METYNINLSDPDADIEEFWYSFKESMYNFYNSLLTCVDTKKYIIEWSNNLNCLKKEKNYNEIENCIKNYVSTYALDLIIYSDLLYHDSIFVANIKRWNKLSKKYNFSNIDNNDIRIIFFMIFFTLKENGVSSKELEVVKNLNKIFCDSNYDDFIIYSLNYNKPKILELLKIISHIKLKNDIDRLFPKFKFNIDSKMVKNCQIFNKIKK